MRLRRKQASTMVCIYEFRVDIAAELWQIFHELDLDNNGHLDALELEMALEKACEFSPLIFTRGSH